MPPAAPISEDIMTGIPPNLGPLLADGAWLQGLANGQNSSYISGIAAAGTSTQAGATQLPPNFRMIQIDTVPANSGVALPPAVPGTEILLFNSTGTTMVIYPSILNNPLTNAQDTVNGGASLSVTGVAGGAARVLFCAKLGAWASR